MTSITETDGSLGDEASQAFEAVTHVDDSVSTGAQAPADEAGEPEREDSPPADEQQ